MSKDNQPYEQTSQKRTENQRHLHAVSDDEAQQYEARQPAQQTPVITDQLATTFRANPEATPEPLGSAWDYGWKVGNVVISRVANKDGAKSGSKNMALSARIREGLEVDGLRVARPIRATDGRYIVAGWRASNYVDGRPEARVDETVAAALRLADRLEDVPDRPDTQAGDPFSRANRAAWSLTETDGDHQLEDGLVRDLIIQVKEKMRPIDAPNQLGHADMLATTLYRGTNLPVLTDIVPVWHPHGYSAAQVMIDGLLAEAVDPGIIERFGFIQNLPQLLHRALAYRLYAHALLENPNPHARAKLAAAVETVNSVYENSHLPGSKAHNLSGASETI